MVLEAGDRTLEATLRTLSLETSPDPQESPLLLSLSDVASLPSLVRQQVACWSQARWGGVGVRK